MIGPCYCPATELTRTGQITEHWQDCAPYLNCTDGLRCNGWTEGIRLFIRGSSQPPGRSPTFGIASTVQQLVQQPGRRSRPERAAV